MIELLHLSWRLHLVHFVKLVIKFGWVEVHLPLLGRELDSTSTTKTFEGGTCVANVVFLSFVFCFILFFLLLLFLLSFSYQSLIFFFYFSTLLVFLIFFFLYLPLNFFLFSFNPHLFPHILFFPLPFFFLFPSLFLLNLSLQVTHKLIFLVQSLVLLMILEGTKLHSLVLVLVIVILSFSFPCIRCLILRYFHCWLDNLFLNRKLNATILATYTFKNRLYRLSYRLARILTKLVFR